MPSNRFHNLFTVGQCTFLILKTRIHLTPIQHRRTVTSGVGIEFGSSLCALGFPLLDCDLYFETFLCVTLIELLMFYGQTGKIDRLASGGMLVNTQGRLARRSPPKG